MIECQALKRADQNIPNGSERRVLGLIIAEKGLVAALERGSGWPCIPHVDVLAFPARPRHAVLRPVEIKRHGAHRSIRGVLFQLAGKEREWPVV